MTPAEWKRLAGPSLGAGWLFAQRLAYITPVGWVVRGILAERAGAGGFYLWIVRMPLYLPTDVIDLSWSERVGGGSHVWVPGGDTASQIAATGREIRDEVATDGSILIAPPGGADNVRMQEARAYGLVLTGDVGAAIEVLGRVTTYQGSSPWEREMVARASRMRVLLMTDEVSAVLDAIAQWRSTLATSVGLVV